VLKAAAQDPAMSVRVAVLSAVANVTDNLAQQSIQPSNDMLPLLTQLAAGDNVTCLLSSVQSETQ